MVDIVHALTLLLLAGATLYAELADEDEPDPYSIEGAKQRYANGEITHDEFERRIDLAECPEAEKIRNAVESISGVGEARSRAIAREFDTYREFKRADRERFESIHGVGDSLATTLHENLTKW